MYNKLLLTYLLKPPLPLHDVDPHLIQQCLGRPHAPPQTAGPTVHALSHSYATKSPLVTMGHPIFVPKIAPSRGPIPKPNYICLIPAPIRPTIPNPIHIRSAVLPQCTGQTDRQTHRPTGMVCDYRPLSLYRQQLGLNTRKIAGNTDNQIDKTL